MKILSRIILVAFLALCLAACSSLPDEKPRSFIGRWVQYRLSDHQLGIAFCGNHQNIEFRENGTFVVTNNYSGIYERFNFSDASKSPPLEGTYKILNDKQMELTFETDGQVDIWNYKFSKSELIFSVALEQELGGGYIPCYFTAAKP